MDVQKVIDELRATADSLAAGIQTITPEQIKPDISITDAVTKIRSVLPSGELYPQVKWQDYGDKQPKVRWVLWDGKHFHEANTLSALVQLALATYGATKVPSDSVAALQDQLTAVPMPF